MSRRPAILLIGSGSEQRHRELLAELGEAADVVLLQPGEIGWQRPLVTRALSIDPTDLTAVLRTVDDLAAGVDGVLSYEEILLPLVGEVTRRTGLPGLPHQASLVVRDKQAQRHLLNNANGLRPVRSVVVRDVEAATAAAATIGYPVVVKPRNMSGSLGVTVVADETELAAAVSFGLAARGGGMDPIGDAIVEEFLDGVEFSVDCWVLDGRAGALFTGRITKGFAPQAVNTGCVVGRGIAEPAALRAIERAGCLAAVECGLNRTIANVDLRWVDGEPRVLEVNGRPAGEALPQLAGMSSGLRVGTALADVVAGRTPAAPPPPHQAAGIAFLYPREAGVFRGLTVPPDLDVVEVRATRAVGDAVAPPPEDPWGRIGWVIATGPDADAVTSTLADARTRIT